MVLLPNVGQGLLILEVFFISHTTAGRTPLDESSSRLGDLYMTTRNTHKRQIPVPWVGFEPTIPASERPQTYVLDSAAIGTGTIQ